MQRAIQWIENTLGLSPETQGLLLLSLLLLLGAWFLRFVVVWVAEKRTQEPEARYFWRKSSRYVAVAASLFLILPLWTRGFQSIATVLGLIAVGLTIVMRDYITSLASWFYILTRRPFKVGDRIQVKTHAGDVVDQGILEFTLLETGPWHELGQSTGRVVNIPNNVVMTEPVVNYNRGFAYIWNEIHVSLELGSDWEKARVLLLEIAQKHTGDLEEPARKAIAEAGERYLISTSVFTPAVFTEVKDGVILLTVRHLSAPRMRRTLTHAIWEDFLRAVRGEERITLKKAP